jgi:ATPase subunit of ABC transporter with duplicated ATPase domains
MFALQNISYIHPDKDLLFESIQMTLAPAQKMALIGANGIGKSTLLRIIAGELRPSEGEVVAVSAPYYVPQVYGQYNHCTVAEALRVDKKITALHEILAGRMTDENIALLDDDWTIEERCEEVLEDWGLHRLPLDQKLETLSGGQKTKVFLAGIAIHQPSLVLLDEPSNHLDLWAREKLYELIQKSISTFVVVSHDRKLLNILDTIGELSNQGLTLYGGNYEFYQEQKLLETNALRQHILSKEKSLRKAREKERETLERQQKLDAKGKKKNEKAGVARIMMNTLRNQAEKSTSKIKSVHTEKIEGIAQDLQELRASVKEFGKMKLSFDDSSLHKGKILFEATAVNWSYHDQPLWSDKLNVQITSGERIALAGANGSGKTTLIKIILGILEPLLGKVYRASEKNIYIDQDYSLVATDRNVYQQLQEFNSAALQEHELKIRLARFLFAKEDWEKPCRVLSGGERMRLMLCSLGVSRQFPDLIVLDEPTNNLDIQSIEILAAALEGYAGTLIVVSHDEAFLQQIGIERTINL